MTGPVTALGTHTLRHLTRAPSTVVLLVLTALLAITSPLVAAHAPRIIEALAGPQVAATTVVPGEPGWRDGGAQWLKNLSQVMSVAVTVVAATTVARALHDGTSVLVLAVGVPRRTLLGVSLAAVHLLPLVIAVGGSALAWAMTWALIDRPPLSTFLVCAAVWFLRMQLVTTAVCLAAVISSSPVGAAGTGLSLLLLLSVGGLWPWAAGHTPAGLGSLAADVMAGHGAGASPWYVVATTLLCSAVLLLAACLVHDRRDLP